MKSRMYIIAVFFLLIRNAVLAQPTNAKGWYERSDIEETEIGYMKTLQFKTPPKPFAQHGWSYTAEQTGFSQKMATWLHQTYTPKGFLGEMILSVLAPEPSYPTTSKYYGLSEAEKNNRNALPNTYGAYIKTYMFLKKTPERKFWPIDGMADYNTWYVMANNITLFSMPITGISTPNDYYFVIPKYSTDIKGEFDTEWYKEQSNYRNFTNNPGLQKYEHFMIPSKTVDPGSSKYVVILTKDRQPLPFDKVTVAELINQLEKQLPQLITMGINGGSKLQNLSERTKTGFQYFRNQYRNRLNELVYISDLNSHISYLTFYNLEPNRDVHWFSTQPVSTPSRGIAQTHFPLLKLRKGVKEACAKTGPQWIVCRLESDGTPANAGEIHRMETFLNGFNYDYLYEYFFGKEKVIQPYKPLAVANNTKPQTVSLAQSSEAKKRSEDKSILFFEDFSTVPAGSTPQNWKTERSIKTGNQISVTELSGAAGKWLKLQRNASPKIFKGFNGDFEMSYDLLVHKGDVPWGTTAMEAHLLFSTSQGEKDYYLKVTPGDLNRKDAAGWITLNLGNSACNYNSYYSIPDFTGSKPTNKVNIGFRKKGQTLTVLCNNNKVYECNTAVAPGLTLKGLNFFVDEMNVYYISNIQVKKL